ncbi:hypothetical protein D3C85_1153910 [compost metagenome]
MRGERLARGRQAGRCAAAAAARAGVDGGKECSVLHPVLGARFLNVQHCHAQVAIVGKAHLDYALQRRIGEDIAPAEIRNWHRCSVGSRRVAGELSGHGSCGLLVGGHQAAAGHQDGERERRKAKEFHGVCLRMRPGPVVHALRARQEWRRNRP